MASQEDAEMEDVQDLEEEKDPREPGIVRKLKEEVVNRIAAGEVIQRPANAVKEMIENSLDAGATSIQVSVQNGGLKVLQIQDNGSGIRREDLPIVCHRFTTSKLKEFSDLGKIATYGFRGEALASITHVAHVTITTRTVNDKCSYKANYSDGELKDTPQPCAGTVGTSITVEDLFYNVTTRQKALKSPGEEYGKIAEVVSRYAIHNASTAFSLKKIGDVKADVRTPANSTVLDNVREIFGSAIARELVPVKVEDVSLKFKLEGYVTNANYSSKKFNFLLFINHRLVDSVAIRKGLEEIYATYLPKHSHPFIYLSLELPPQNVDVNVHPTKHEVFILNQDSIVEKIQQIVDGHLVGHKSSRTFYTQTYLPLAPKPSEQQESGKQQKPLATSSKHGYVSKKEEEKEREYAHDVVRTDAKSQKLEKFFPKVAPKGDAEKREGKESKEGYRTPGWSARWRRHAKPRRDIRLTSIKEMRLDVEAAVDKTASDIIHQAVFVGVVSPDIVCFQSGTKLFLGDLTRLFEELFYQIAIYEFGNFGKFCIKQPAPLRELVRIGLDMPETGWREEHGSKDELTDHVIQLLNEKSAMLEDYFGIEFDENGNILTLPILLDNFLPNVHHLPFLLMKLACDVNWDREKDCLQGLCRQMARFYALRTKDVEAKGTEEGEEVSKVYLDVVEHVIFPALKSTLAPPRKLLLDRSIFVVADTKNLYKVFERC